MEPGERGSMKELKSHGYQRELDNRDEFDDLISTKIRKILQSHHIDKIID